MFDIIEGAFPDPRAAGRVTVVKGDLVAGTSLLDTLKKFNVKLVFHVASPHPNGSNRRLFYDVNVTGTAAVIKACLDADIRALIYTSSASVVWAGEGQEGVDESAPLPPVFRDYYAETKAEAERLVMEAGRVGGADGLVTVSLRPHAIWGPRDPQMVGITIATAKAGRMRGIVGDGKNVVDWTYVGNVVHGHMLAAQTAWRAVRPGGGGRRECAASGRTYFITNGEPKPFWTFMNEMILAFGYDTSTFRMPYAPLIALAHVAQGAVQLVNACPRAAGSKPIELTFSPSRLQIAGTAHWYSIAAAARDLGYAPLWSLAQGLYLTVKAFPALRNPKPSEATLAKARRGNLVALGLVLDPAGKRATGANDAFRDASALPEFTAAEVRTHASRDDAWIIIDGLVYDVSDYVEAHPGGEDNILRNVGGDASKGFHGEQHPAHVFETVRKFLVGRLKK